MKKMILLGALALLTFGCKKEDGAVDVTIQNTTKEPFAVKLTQTNWVAVDVGEYRTFSGYLTRTLENTQVLIFTADESPEAFSNVVSCPTCSDDEIKPPYGGGVRDEFFDLRRERKVKMDGEEVIPGITILAEPVDSLYSGPQDRDIQKIRLRIIN